MDECKAWTICLSGTPGNIITWPLDLPGATPDSSSTVTATASPSTVLTSAGSTTAGSTTTGSTTAGSTTSGSTTAGSTTAGSTTEGSTTAGSTTAGSTTAGSTIAGSTTAGSTTTGSTTAGSSTVGSTTAGSFAPGSSDSTLENFERPPPKIFKFYLDADEFCENKVLGITMLPSVRSFEESEIACRQLRSQMYTYTKPVKDTIEDPPEPKEEEICIWTGHKRDSRTGEFIAIHSDNKTILDSDLVWKWGEPNGGVMQECSALLGM